MAIARILRETFGLRLPAGIAKEFTAFIQKHFKNCRLTPTDLNTLFCTEFIENTHPFELIGIDFVKEFVNTPQERIQCQLDIKHQNTVKTIEGFGTGTLHALINAFATHYDMVFELKDYLQHSLTQVPHILAASYILLIDKNATAWWGVGIDRDCTLSAIRALLSAINRSQKNQSFSLLNPAEEANSFDINEEETITQ